VIIDREGTTAYLKLAYHAPAATDPDFFPMLLLDGVLTGAKGLNLWSSFRGAPPQRKARLYTALVEKGLASIVGGALLPTAQPFLYTISLTAMAGVDLAVLERATLEALAEVTEHGVTEKEVERARRQLRTRLVFDNDSVTNIAHQLGYFETVTGPGYFDEVRGRIDAVTAGQVSEAATRRLQAASRTVGWFRPLKSGV
jgi:zinc protease